MRLCFSAKTTFNNMQSCFAYHHTPCYQWCWVCIRTDRNSGRNLLCCCSCDHTHHSDPYTHQHLKETQWYQGIKFCNSSTLDSTNFRFHFPFDLKSVCIGPVQVQIDKQINQNEERIKRNKMKLVHIDKGRLIMWTMCFLISVFIVFNHLTGV